MICVSHIFWSSFLYKANHSLTIDWAFAGRSPSIISNVWMLNSPMYSPYNA